MLLHKPLLGHVHTTDINIEVLINYITSVRYADVSYVIVLGAGDFFVMFNSSGFWFKVEKSQGLLAKTLLKNHIVTLYLDKHIQEQLFLSIYTFMTYEQPGFCKILKYDKGPRNETKLTCL